MSLNNITISPRFIDVVNIDDEAKKQIRVFVGNISEKEALIMFEEDIDKKLYMYLKRMCRNSFEYKEYIRHFKEVLKYTRCKVFNIDITEVPVSLEIHHTPFSLETIVVAVTAKMFEERGVPLDPKDIAEEVMRLHYDGKIGLIPLTSTIHEAVHSNAVHIKSSDIYGNYQAFFEEYEEYLSEDAIQHYNNVISLTDEEIDLYNKEKLKRVISEYNVVYEDDDDSLKYKKEIKA
jgi:hypothetical protein